MSYDSTTMHTRRPATATATTTRRYLTNVKLRRNLAMAAARRSSTRPRTPGRATPRSTTPSRAYVPGHPGTGVDAAGYVVGSMQMPNGSTPIYQEAIPIADHGSSAPTRMLSFVAGVATTMDTESSTAEGVSR